MVKLKEIREARGMTQAELAEKSGLGIRSIRAYEQGQRDINEAAVISVYRLSKTLNCSVEDLLEIKP